MPGLVAIISHDPARAVSDSELTRLACAYESLRGEGGRAIASAGAHARVAKIGDPGGAQPEIERSGGAWAATVGPVRGLPSAAHIDLDDLDGQFGLVAYDAVSGEVSVATDPFGMHAVYLTQRGDTTYVSTSALCLAKHSGARPSPLGLRAFLRSGYQFGTMTNWEGVERLDPGTCVRFSGGQPSRECYWRASVDREVTRLGLRQAVDHSIEVAVSDMATNAGETTAWSDLTAGFDSRVLNLLLRRAGVDLHTNTVGTPHEPDVRIARRIASKAGWQWSAFAVPDDWTDRLPGLLRGALAWGDGHLEVVQLARVLWVHALQGETFPALYNGGGGEHLRSYAWNQEFLRAGRSRQVSFDNWVDMRMLAPLDTSIFRRDPTPEVRDDFRRRGAAWIEPLSSELNTTKLDALYAYKCTGHFGAYHSAAAGSLTTRLPFYCKRSFTTAHSVDFRLRNRHRLMRSMIDRLDPDIAAIETEPGGPAAPWRPLTAHRFLPYYRRIARTAVRKARRRAGPVRLSTAGANDAAAQRRAVLRMLGGGRPPLHGGFRSAPLYDPRALEAFLASAERPDFGQAALFGRVVTVELGLRENDAALDEGVLS